MSATVDSPLPSTVDKHAPPEYLHRVVPGFKRADLARLFAEKGYRRGAEIGVAEGKFSEVLCRQIPGLDLTCVDPWRKYPSNLRGGAQEQHDWNLVKAKERLSPYDVTFVQAMSLDAVRDVPFNALDFVYIDAHHSFDWVVQDLIEWSKRVRSGGIVSGHDFYHFRWAGVVEAVVGYTTSHGITDWHICDEREPSFWWVKP